MRRYFSKIKENEETVNANLNHLLDKMFKPEKFYTEHESIKRMYKYLSSHEELNKESKDKVKDFENKVKQYYNKIINNSSVLKNISKDVNKKNANEFIRAKLSNNGKDFNNKDFSEMHNLISEYFTGEREGWFGGLENFINFVKAGKNGKI